jgi:phytol kinase
VLRRAVVFIVLWLLVGFSTGTSTLLGPVMWITEHGRAAGWSEGAESLVVRGVIAVYVAGSALIALWLTRIVVGSRLAHVRYGVPALALLAALSALWLWMTPGATAAWCALETSPGSSFTFGPLPDEARMTELKRDGYTTVVSLLHPAVVPFEPRLITEGRASAERAGLEFINVPMLPWVSDNPEALTRIEELARTGSGRYYVHCYLGRDRIRLARRVVERAEPAAETVLELAAPVLVDGQRFERGEVIEVEPNLWLTPYPTDDEMMRYILPGSHGAVVSLLDPGNPDDLPWIEKEGRLLAAHGVDFYPLPLPHRDYDPERAVAVAREVATLPRPLVVHAFHSPTSGRSPTAEAFLQAWRSGLPPLPPALFSAPMAEGDVRIVAPNVAVGPRPRPQEMALYLVPRGVRDVARVGAAPAEETGPDSRAVEEAGLGWHTLESDGDAVIDLVSADGPWYLYGPDAPAVSERIAARLGPAIPEAPPSETVVAEETPAAGTAGRADDDEDAAAPPAPAAVRPSPRTIRGMIPTLRTVILAGPVLLLFTALAASLAGWLRAVRKIDAPYTRKVFHFVIFTMAGVLYLAGGLPVVNLFGVVVSGAVLYAVVRGDGFAFYESMARPSDAPRRTLFILLPLLTTAVGGLASALLFGAFAYVGYLVAGWGDAIGEPVGAAYGRTRYRVPSLGGVAATRSLEGSTAVFLVGTLAAFLGMTAGGVPLASALAVALACGVGCTAVEAVSTHGLDNLTIQLTASGTAWLLLA